MRFSMVAFCALAVIAAPTHSHACTDAVPQLGQDWPAQTQTFWYQTGTGSRLIPDAWYRALVRADDGTAFAARANLAGYGFAYCGDKAGDPIGFVLDADPARPPAIGLTCAACHTGQLTDGNRSFLVHGAAATLDLQRFTEDLFAAVLKVRSGPYDSAIQTEDWRAFSAKVLGTKATETASMALHAELSAWLLHRKDVQGSVHKGGIWGFGRMDLAQITRNTVANLVQGDGVSKLPAATAPVSIPPLWLTARVTARGLPHPPLLAEDASDQLLRDVAKTIGIFADVDLPAADAQYQAVKSSVRTENLNGLRRSLASLTPPLWPQVWGPIDRTTADYRAGATLYDTHCAACHARIDRAKPQQAILDASGLAMVQDPLRGTPFVRRINAFDRPGVAGGLAVGTDPMALCNGVTHSTGSGRVASLTDIAVAWRSYRDQGARGASLERFAPGTEMQYLVEDLALRILWQTHGALPDKILSPEAVAFFTWLAGADQVAQSGVATGQPSDATPQVTAMTHRLTDLAKVRAVCAAQLARQEAKDPSASRPGYQAWPLAGIFATAPYLHNGSVPTLDALLRPAEARPDMFAVGAVLFDPVKVGLGPAIAGAAHVQFKVTDLRGRIIAGNSNEGHAYPAEPLTEVERAQLILYLKGM